MSWWRRSEKQPKQIKGRIGHFEVEDIWTEVWQGGRLIEASSHVAGVRLTPAVIIVDFRVWSPVAGPIQVRWCIGAIESGFTEFWCKPGDNLHVEARLEISDLAMGKSPLPEIYA